MKKLLMIFAALALAASAAMAQSPDRTLFPARATDNTDYPYNGYEVHYYANRVELPNIPNTHLERIRTDRIEEALGGGEIHFTNYATPILGTSCAISDLYSPDSISFDDEELLYDVRPQLLPVTYRNDTAFWRGGDMFMPLDLQTGMTWTCASPMGEVVFTVIETDAAHDMEWGDEWQNETGAIAADYIEIKLGDETDTLVWAKEARINFLLEADLRFLHSSTKRITSQSRPTAI